MFTQYTMNKIGTNTKHLIIKERHCTILSTKIKNCLTIIFDVTPAVVVDIGRINAPRADKYVPP